MKTLVSFILLGILINGCAVAKTTTQEAKTPGLVCEPTGCSGQICAEKGKSIITTCLMLPQYECFNRTRCEVQSDGRCGWTPNREFLACLKKHQPAQTH